MAVTHVQSQIASASAATVNAVLGATPTAGNLLVALAYGNLNTTDNSTLALTGTTGWNVARDQDIPTSGTANNVMRMYWKKADGTESTTTTLTQTGAGFVALCLVEYAGVSATSPLGVGTGANSLDLTVLTLASGSTATTTIADAVGVAYYALEANGGALVSWTNSYSARQGVGRMRVSDKFFNALQTENTTATWTSLSRAGIQLVVFYATDAGAAAARLLMLLGCGT